MPTDQKGHHMSTTTRRLWRRTASIAVGGLLAAGALAATAPSAAADPFRCPPDVGSDGSSLCATVIGIDPGSYLTVRSGPGTGYEAIGRRSPGQTVEVECWTYGTPVNGYSIWTRLYSGSRPSWVSDYYLSTGRVQDHLPRC